MYPYAHNIHLKTEQYNWLTRFSIICETKKILGFNRTLSLHEFPCSKNKTIKIVLQYLLVRNSLTVEILHIFKCKPM